MECSQCGSNQFQEVPILNNEGAKLVGVQSFACLKCGHIETYLIETKLEAIKQGRINKAIIEKKEKEYTLRKEQLTQEAENLQKVINDENSTVKHVNEAKKKLEEIKKELSKNPFGF